MATASSSQADSSHPSVQRYDNDGVIYVRLSGLPYAQTIAIDALRLVDLAANGDVIGVEFLGVEPSQPISLARVPASECIAEQLQLHDISFTFEA